MNAKNVSVGVPAEGDGASIPKVTEVITSPPEEYPEVPGLTESVGSELSEVTANTDDEPKELAFRRYFDENKKPVQSDKSDRYNVGSLKEGEAILEGYRGGGREKAFLEIADSSTQYFLTAAKGLNHLLKRSWDINV